MGSREQGLLLNLKDKCSKYEKEMRQAKKKIKSYNDAVETKNCLIKDLKWKVKKLENAIGEKNGFIEKLKTQIKTQETQISIYKRSDYCYHEVLKSKTYKIGMFITWLPRRIIAFFRHN